MTKNKFTPFLSATHNQDFATYTRDDRPQAIYNHKIK